MFRIYKCKGHIWHKLGPILDHSFSGHKLWKYCSVMLFSPCSACLLVEYAENFGIETIAAWNIREWTHTHGLLHQVCVPVPYHLGGMGMGLLTYLIPRTLEQWFPYWWSDRARHAGPGTHSAISSLCSQRNNTLSFLSLVASVALLPSLYCFQYLITFSLQSDLALKMWCESD